MVCSQLGLHVRGIYNARCYVIFLVNLWRSLQSVESMGLLSLCALR